MRKTIKRSLSVLLACLVMMSMATVALADGATATLAIGTDSGEAGDAVAVSVSVTGTGINSGVFKVTYDEDTLTFVNATSAYSVTAARIAEDTLSVAFASTTAVSGTVATLNFTIAAGASAGSYDLTPSFAAADPTNLVEADGLFADDTRIADVTLTAGSVTVEETPAFTRGDVNGDGEVDSDDAIYLLNHTLRPAKYPLIGDTNGDMNGDGEIDSDDAIYLLNHTLRPAKYPLA